jgi:hypothetical protein
MRVQALLMGVAVLLAVPFGTPATAAQAVAEGCTPGASSDFNGDGWSDAVVGDPFATVDGLREAGQIVVLYGDSDGLVGEGARTVLWQGTAAVGQVPESGDRFGSSLAVADLNSDDFTDVVVGTPLEDVSGHTDSGYVQVLWGAASGLATTTPSTDYTQTWFGGSVVSGDQFGFAVDAVEDVGQDGTPAPSAYALAIGVPGANVAGHNNAGAVAVQAAYDGGVESYWITQNTSGVSGAAESGDGFGSALSCNYLSGVSSEIDCAVGTPFEDIGARKDAGTVTVLQDVGFGLAMVGFPLDQNTAGVPGSAEAGDFYGRSIDTVVVDGTARIAVGAPGENVGSDSNAGTVQLFSSDTREIDPGTGLTQDTTGVGDSTQAGDIFGDEVAWLAPGGGDPQTSLAVSAPKEDTLAGRDAGLVQVFTMNNLALDVVWTQDSAGVPGTAAGGDLFGQTLATVAGSAERVLVVGVPDDTALTTGMVDVIPIAAGTPRSWDPGSTAGASRFGASLGSVSGSAA